MSCCWNNPQLLPGSRAEGRLPVVTSYDLLGSISLDPGAGETALGWHTASWSIAYPPIGVVAGRLKLHIGSAHRWPIR